MCPSRPSWRPLAERAVEAKAASEHRSERTPRCVSEERRRQRRHRPSDWRASGGEGGIRTRDGLPRTAFPVRRHSPLGDLSHGRRVATRRAEAPRDLSTPAGRPGEGRARGPQRAHPIVRERGPEKRTHDWACAGVRSWRRGRDSNPRCFRTPLFESGTINHSDTSPPVRIPKPGRPTASDGGGRAPSPRFR
jgi:hypothetical protein